MPHQHVAHHSDVAEYELELPELDEVTARHVADHADLMVRAANKLVEYYAESGIKFRFDFAYTNVHEIAMRATEVYEIENVPARTELKPSVDNTLHFHDSWRKIFIRLMKYRIIGIVRKKTNFPDIDLH